MNKACIRFSVIGILVVASLIISFTGARACTRIFWNNNGQAMLVARNMDFSTDDLASFMVFPKGMYKQGDPGDPTNSYNWVSQYGSVVITAFGQTDLSKSDPGLLTADGVNTAGLAFHGLWLNETSYPAPSGKHVLEGRYGAFLLDNAATVSDALTLLQEHPLKPEGLGAYPFFPIHMALEDKLGDSAVIEWVGGHMYVYHGSAYNTTVLTNDPTFDLQLENLLNYEYFDGTLALPGDVDPMSRFVRASAFLKTLSKPASPAEAVSLLFSAIRSCTTASGAGWYSSGTFYQASPTLWTVVYDLTHSVIYFQHVDPRNDFRIDMKKLNFHRDAGVVYLNAERPDLNGDVSRLFRRVSNRWGRDIGCDR